MATPQELRLVCDALARPPFNRQLSVIALHDDLTHEQLVALISQAIGTLDDSPAHKIDIRNELPENTAARLADFLRNAVKLDSDMLDVYAKQHLAPAPAPQRNVADSNAPQ